LTETGSSLLTAASAAAPLFVIVSAPPQRDPGRIPSSLPRQKRLAPRSHSGCRFGELFTLTRNEVLKLKWDIMGYYGRQREQGSNLAKLARNSGFAGILLFIAH
jgi:hypothetical protein